MQFGVFWWPNKGCYDLPHAAVDGEDGAADGRDVPPGGEDGAVHRIDTEAYAINALHYPRSRSIPARDLRPGKPPALGLPPQLEFAGGR